MNPWGLILIAMAIILVMIGVTGSQHTILQTMKGIPASARGTPAKKPAAQNPNPGSQATLA
jgi:hypothetical protein